MPTLVEQYLAEHFALNSISDTRKHQVTVSLVRLERFIGKPLEEISDTELRAWLINLLGEGLKASTVLGHLKAVRPFYRWAWLRKDLSADTWMRLREVRAPRGSGQPPPRPYSRKELDQMWDALDARWPYVSDRIYQRWLRGTSPYRSVKKHAMRLQLDAIIELALVCGLRRIEIMRLELDDCHWDNKYIVVDGKRVDQNAKLREVPYPDTTRAAIRRWIRMRVRMNPEPGLPLWLSITGQYPASGLSSDRSDQILRSIGPYQLHRLRHTCATERLRAGMEIEKLQRFLGHATIGQTLVYAQLARGDIHKAAAASEPEFQKAIRRRAA